MTNDAIIKNTAASSSSTDSGYAYIFPVNWFALLSIVVLNTEIELLVSVLLEFESGIAIVFFVICSVNILYLSYFWIKVFRKMLIYSTAEMPRRRHLFLSVQGRCRWANPAIPEPPGSSHRHTPTAAQLVRAPPSPWRRRFAGAA